MPEGGREEVRDDDPTLYAHPTCRAAAFLAANWELGILPCSGGILDQPARAVAAMGMWNQAKAHCEELLREHNARKGKGAVDE